MNAASDYPPPLVDAIAVSASLLCLVHCLALPLVVAFLPALGLLATHSTSVHALLLALALPLGVWSLIRRRQRAGLLPLLSGLAGFAMMAGALLVPIAAETWLTVAGVSLVAVAHWRNWRAGHRIAAEHQSSDASSIL